MGFLPKYFLQPFFIQNLIGHQVLLTLYIALSNPYVMMAFVGFREIFWIPHLGIRTWSYSCSPAEPRGCCPCLMQFLTNYSRTEISSNTIAFPCFSPALRCSMRIHIILDFLAHGELRGQDARILQCFLETLKNHREKMEGLPQDLSTQASSQLSGFP